jgi:hypothetical protein
VGYAVIGACWALGTTFGASALEKVTVCEALANPLKYDGKMILLEGEIHGTDEGGWLTATACPTQFMTGGHVWPNFVFLQDPTDKHNLHKVDFEYDFGAEKHFLSESDKLEKKNPGRKLRWVYEGLFETRTDWDSALVTDRSGGKRYVGFGHLGEAPAQLIVKAIRAVSLAP